MRVISGGAKGRKLKTPSGDGIRPTCDKVKESIFNIIQFDLEGASVLDLFAGTGQLGIEALSRGAKSAVFVDNSSAASTIIRDNLKACGFSGSAKVYTSDALRSLERDEKFDIIFIDPPYDTNLAASAIFKIASIDKLNENGIIIAEMREGGKMPEITPPYELSNTYKYGGTWIIKLTRREWR